MKSYNEKWESAYNVLVKKHEEDAKKDENEMQSLHAQVATLESQQLMSTSEKSGRDEEVAKVKRELVENHKVVSSLRAEIRQAREVNLAQEAALQKSRAKESKLQN